MRQTANHAIDEIRSWMQNPLSPLISSPSYIYSPDSNSSERAKEPIAAVELDARDERGRFLCTDSLEAELP
ncbi:unnamed protein product [Boreogadus saida]